MTVLSVFGILAACFAVVILLVARSALHEIEALIAFLIFTVALTGSLIIEELRSMKALLAARLAPPICQGCGQFFEGNGAVVHTGKETKRVCPTCAKTLAEDAETPAA